MIDHQALAELKARHLAFVERRILGPEAEEAWRENVIAGIDALLDAPLGSVFPPEVVATAFERVATGAAFDALVPPIARTIEALALAELGADDGEVGDRVPGAARRALSRLLARKGLAPERFIREVCQQDAARELMREVLNDALREFQDKVNPFSADWGLSALLKKLSPFGLGVGKGFEGFRADFEKRIDPEIKKFLQGASRHALARMAEMMITKWDEPSFVALREELLRWALAQPSRDLAESVPADVLGDVRTAALDFARGILVDPGLALRRRTLFEEFVAARRNRSVREALAAIGIEIAVDRGALADLTWPAAKTALASPAARAFFASLVGDFYDAEIAASSNSPAG